MEALEKKETEMIQAEAPKTETAGAEAIVEKLAKKGHGKLILFSVLMGLVVVLAAVYIGIGVYYQTHFLPNTTLNSLDVSGMDATQAAKLVDAWAQDYTLEVTGRNPITGESGTVLGTITPDAIQLTYSSSESTLADMLNDQHWLMWIKAFLGQEQECFMERGVATFDEELLEDLVKGWDACQAANMLIAQDACISEYNSERQIYEIIPETKGTELDVAQATLLIEDTLFYMLRSTLDLEEAGLYAEPKILQDDRSLTDPVETANLWLGTSIVYDWNGNEVVLDAETIQEWVTIEDGVAVLDEEAVKNFVKTQSRNYDTYGKQKTFVTTLGVEMTLNSASYGWRTDMSTETEELLELIREGSTEPREPVYTHQGMVKGVDDIGDTYVEADLTNQHLYLYQDGEVVLETDFVSGKISNGNGTPAGIFGITYKTTNAVLRGENYATLVNYWMPFYGDFGMHDAAWRAAFGGDIFLNDGSHGCINLPKAMAEEIYGYVSTGFPVICYYYEQPIASEGEEQPDPEEAAAAEQQPASEQ